MTFSSLAVKNLLRRKGRALLTGAGIAAAAACMLSILAIDRGYERALREEMSASGIHMFVSTEGCPTEAASLVLHGGQVPKYLPMERFFSVKDIAGVKEAVGLLILAVPAPDGSRLDLFYGIGDEAKTLKPHWKIRGSWFRDENSVILGAEAARVEKRDVGDRLYLESLDREFEVVGILERTSTEDDGFFFLPLAAMQKHFKKEGKLTGIGVAVEDLEEIKQVGERITELPDVYVVTMQQMAGEILKVFASTKTFMYSMMAVALVISLLGVMNTVLMSVLEMRREFGYMRCVGAGRGDVLRIVLLETATIGLAGGCAGVALAAASSSLIERFVRKTFVYYTPAGSIVEVTLPLVLLSLAAVTACAVAAGLYPAWRAAAVSPIEAVRDE
jgi:putative ABC transport system permease protein